MDDRTLVLHSMYSSLTSFICRNGYVQICSIDMNVDSFSMVITEELSTITPFATCYNSISVDSALDCVVLYNKGVSPDSSISIYTTSLQLRGYIKLPPDLSIQQLYITQHGILIVTSSIIYRYSFCGDADGSAPMETIRMYFVWI